MGHSLSLPKFRRDLIAPASQYRLALYSGMPGNVDAYSAQGEIPAGGGYVTGGIMLGKMLVNLFGAVVCIDFQNPVIQNATIAAAFGMIYAEVPAKPAAFILDFGGVIRSTNGPWSPGLPEPGPKTSLLQWSP